MRTRANGQPLTEAGIIEDAMKLGQDGGPVDATVYFELRKDLSELLSRERKQAFDEGMQLSGRIMQRENERTAAHLVQLAAAVLGKDRGDGVIRFETYPDPAVYNWNEEDAR